MRQVSAFVVAVALAAACVSADVPVRPMGSIPSTLPSIHTGVQNLIQAGVEDTSFATVPMEYLGDDELANATMGGAELTIENMKQKLTEEGVSPDGTRKDLMTRLANAFRVKNVMNGAMLNNNTALKSVLEQKGEVFSEADGPAALFQKLAARVNKELFLTNPARKIVDTISPADLSEACEKRGLPMDGPPSQLISILYSFQKDCDDVVELMPGFTCTVGKIEDALASRGLSKLGRKDELMARLAEALRAGGAGGGSLETEMCDLVAAGPICLAGGAKVLAADAAPKGMSAHFTFDDAKGLDCSGKSNHGKKAPSFGPGVGSHGSSAKFNGNDWFEIPHHNAYASKDFTISMWLYLLQDSMGQWRTVMHKAEKDRDRTPTLFLEPLTRGIEFFVTTTDVNQPAGERLWSNTFIPLRRWTHVAAVAEGHSMRLYINGLLDSENTTVGSIVLNQGPIYLGSDPWRPAGGMPGYIDEFKYYARAVTTDEIQAEASFALGGVEPNYVELGCMGCSLDNALATCRSGYHLCNLRDLYAGGYVVARSMGWATSTSKIWSAEESSGGASGGMNASVVLAAAGTATSGLGLCCADTE